MSPTDPLGSTLVDTRDIAARLGIEKFDVVGASTEEATVQVNDGKPQQMRASKRNAVTVRVWNREGLTGVATTNTLDEQGLITALSLAKETAAYGNADNKVDFSPESKAPLARKVDSSSFVAEDVDTLLSALLDAEKRVLEGHPAIKSVPYNALSQRRVDRFYMNSEGVLRTEGVGYLSGYLYTRTEEEGRKPRSAGLSEVARSLSALNLPGLASKVVAKTSTFLEYKRIPSGSYTVVFSGEAFLSLLEAFSNLFNAQSVLDNQSLSKASDLGTPIASPLLSLADDPLHAANEAPQTFDGEGTPTRRIEVIGKGVLTSFLHSAGTAQRMGATPTGHANMGAKITVGSHFWHVGRGEAPEGTRSVDTEPGVIVVDEVHSLHAGVNALQGSFSLPFSGWIHEAGTRTSIESATVAGDFRALLRGIRYVEDKEEHTPGGVCPRIWVEGLSVTSESNT